MSEVVKIRGLKSGLQLIVDKNAKFEEVKETLLNKLTTGDKFFIRGTTVFVDKNFFNDTQIEELRRMFHRHGMLFSDKLPTFQPKFEPKPAPAPVAPAPTPKIEKAIPTVIIDKTLRGGQEVRTESSVLVFGNVNPGAQIIAGGSIDIRGACLGYVHAGAFGDKKAFIVADKLRPIQIRIADLVARPPDRIEEEEKLLKSKKPKRKSIVNFIGHSENDTVKSEENQKAERASIKNGYIVFEPVMRNS